MEERKANWYSIVRYKADELTGEVINVGVILHSFENDEEMHFKYLFIDENADKIKAITSNSTEIALYKTYKDNMQYYIDKSTENLLGQVGQVIIDSPAQNGYMESLFEFHKNERLFLTRPKYSLTKNVDLLFEKIFEIYVGSRYLYKEDNVISTKRHMKKMLEEQSLLNKKVISDHIIAPIEELENVQIKVDFSYKNGVWNYMQGIPLASGPSQSTEWFAKTKFMFENLQKDSKIKLLYRSTETYDEEFMSMLEYFTKDNENVEKLDIDNQHKVKELFEQIANEAHDIDELMTS